MKPIALTNIAFLGQDLHRPECVLATSSGRLFASDWLGGVAAIARDGQVARYLANLGPVPETGLKPNGIALRRDGSFLIAHLGAEAGGLGRPHLDGIKSKRLRNVSSLAFGGPDRKTVYLGCLLGTAIASFRSPVTGHPPAHWIYEP